MSLVIAQKRHRKLNGDYPTPLIWVQEAYHLLDQCIGPNWNQTMTVWDASCGAGNLVRLRSFSSLIATTLKGEDLDLIHTDTRVQRPLDFLSSITISDDISDILLHSDAILFLNNPPYKTVNEQTFHGRVRRPAGHTNTVVKQAMKRVSLNRAGDQLSVQFMFKITEIMRMQICNQARFNNRSIYMGIFIPANILTGPAYHSFRSYLLQHWDYTSAFMMPAKAFSGVNGIFSIVFVIWRCRMDMIPSPSHIKFDVRLLQSDIHHTNVEDIGHLTLSPARYDQRINLWAKSRRSSTSNLCSMTPLTSPLTVQTTCRYSALTQLPSDAIGYLHSNGNSVQHNGQLVGLYSSAFAAGHGVVVRPDNFERICAVFTARRLITRTWSNWLLEYCWPRVASGFDCWCRDAVIFALFDVKANQSALRSPRIINQWFWMGRDHIRSCSCDKVAVDLGSDHPASERFVYQWIQRNRSLLGAEAETLLSFAENTVSESMWLRLEGDYGTDSWDAGWYQIRKLICSHGGDEARRFLHTWNQLRARLAAHLIDGVYKFGFLPRQ